jgi:hypothetical protein
MRNAMKKTSKGKNLKSCISCNGYKSISHNIMQGCPFLTMHTMKKVYPHKIQKFGYKCNATPQGLKDGKDPT